MKHANPVLVGFMVASNFVEVSLNLPLLHYCYLLFSNDIAHVLDFKRQARLTVNVYAVYCSGSM